MSRTRWKEIKSDRVTRMRNKMQNQSFRERIWPAITSKHEIGNYGTGGEGKARTCVKWGDFRDHFETRDQMHSEMRALDHMLREDCVLEKDSTPREKKWRLTNDGRVEGAKGENITIRNYSTNLTHCRFCTVMLHLLGLPIKEGYATDGNYKKANELNYQLPEEVRNSPVVLGRLLTGHSPPDHRDECLVTVKKALNSLLENPSNDEWVLDIGGQYVTNETVHANSRGKEERKWTELSNHKINVDVPNYGRGIEARRFLWKIGFDGLYKA